MPPSTSPSPTSSPSTRSPARDLRRDSLSKQTVPEDAVPEANEASAKVSRPSISFANAGAARDGRRPSIQFAPSAEAPVRPSRPRQHSLRFQGRLSSPPPPSYIQAKAPKDKMSGPTTHTKSSFGESSSMKPASKTPEPVKETAIVSFEGIYSPPVTTSSTIVLDTTPPLTPLRTSVLKDKATPLASELVFHGSGEFLASEFHELQSAVEYHEERYQRQPISQRQRENQELTQGDGDYRTYETRVSFDTFDNKNATDISFTLVCKHKDYKYSRRSRTFLCGNDENDYSEFALEWLVDELVEDGDEIVCLRVVDRDSTINSKDSVERETYKQEAQELLQKVQEKNGSGKSISLVLELAVGKVEDMIQRMIKIYSPVSLIVGTRGRPLGGIQGLFPGSVSRYCLQNSPVPVIVVRPEDKRKKKREKRSAQSASSVYTSILDQTPPTSNDIPHNQTATSGTGATEGERSAVAEAVGVRPDWDGEQTERQSSVVEIGVDQAMAALLDRSFDAHVESNPETPSPRGPLMIDTVDYDMPEVDLGRPARNNVDVGEGGDSGEGSSKAGTIKGIDKTEHIKTLSSTEAGEELGNPIELDEDEEMQKGLASSRAAYEAAQAPKTKAEIMAENLANFHKGEHLTFKGKEFDEEEMRVRNLAEIGAGGNDEKGKGKENDGF